MTVIRVGDAEQQQADGDKDAQVDQELAGLFGAAEVKRISLAMVEAAFDGCAADVANNVHLTVEISASAVTCGVLYRSTAIA